MATTCIRSHGCSNWRTKKIFMRLKFEIINRYIYVLTDVFQISKSTCFKDGRTCIKQNKQIIINHGINFAYTPSSILNICKSCIKYDV